MLRASIAAEKAGIPAVSVVATSFLPMARAIAKGLGITDPPIAEYPGVPMIDSDTQLRDKVIQFVLPQVLNGWQRRAKAGVHLYEDTAEPDPRDIVFKGTLHEVQDFFEDQLWSDGLPIIPPTLDKVEEFLKFTDRAADDVIGICLPEYREATIWNVAVNGLMAGCRPEYMPVLIAVVEAITDPKFFLEDAGVTPGWEPLVIINGPIIKELNFNYSGGVMRVGRRPNTSIGRFVRLFIRNVPGQRIPPGVTDKACIGITFNVVLAENEDAVAEIGWDVFSASQGHKRGDNVVTVQSVVAVTQPTYTGGAEARNHVQIMSEAHGPSFAYWSFTGMRHNAWYPLFVLSPSVAKAIADDGWTQDDIRKYLYENTMLKASLAEKYARNAAVNDFDLKDLVRRGVLPSRYHESDDPDRLVPVFFKPEWINFVVAGDAGRNQSRAYIQNHRHGVPVSKKVKLPDDWQLLMQQSRKR